MTTPNKHGLSRAIPDPIKQIIRENSCFGCVICGIAIYDYEHIDPPFAEATSHDPEKMTLLCGGCHTMKTRGMLSLETVLEAKKFPAARKKGYSHFAFDLRKDFVLQVGNTEFHNLRDIIIVDGESLLSVKPPASSGQPLLINAKFYDGAANLIAEIVENEWRGVTTAFDIKTSGPTITIRERVGQISLTIRYCSSNRLVIDVLNFSRKTTVIRGSTSNGYKISSSRSSVVIPPHRKIVSRSRHWLSVSDEQITVGTNHGMDFYKTPHGPPVHVPGEYAVVDAAVEFFYPPKGDPRCPPNHRQDEPVIHVKAKFPGGGLHFNPSIPLERLL